MRLAHLHRSIAFAAAALLAGPAQAALGPDDRLIVPGERVGAVTQETTEDDLVKRFGQPNVVRRLVPDGDDGEFSCAIALMPKTSRELILRWRDMPARYRGGKGMGAEDRAGCERAPLFTRIASVTIPAGSKWWKTKEGVAVGSRLTSLVQANGADVSFYAAESGCGDVSDWHGGIFAKRLGASLDYKGRCVADPARVPALAPYWTKGSQTLESDALPARMQKRFRVRSIEMELNAADAAAGGGHE